MPRDKTDTSFKEIISYGDSSLRIEKQSNAFEISKSQQGITAVYQPTEIKEALVELNKDDLNEETHMSDIDLRTNLDAFDIPAIWSVDGMVSFRVMPKKALILTRQLKRLLVSKDAMGRNNIVDVVGRKQQGEIDRSSGFSDRIKNFFSRQ